MKNNKVIKKTHSVESFIDKKLSIYVSIVPQGHANSIIKIMEKCGAAANFVETGEGTARQEILNILGLVNNDKEIVFTFISQDKISEIKTLLDVYFSSRKQNAGIGFSIPLSSIIGVKVYQFLADTIA